MMQEQDLSKYHYETRLNLNKYVQYFLCQQQYTSHICILNLVAIRDPTIKFPRILGGSKLVKNAILKPSVTMPGVVQQPEVEQEAGNPTEPQELDDIHHEKGEKKKDEEDRQQKQMEREQLQPRGDVFCESSCLTIIPLYCSTGCLPVKINTQ